MTKRQTKLKSSTIKKMTPQPFLSIPLSFTLQHYYFHHQNMASKLLLLLLFLILHNISPPFTVAQCPYACGNTPPATTVPPPATTLPPPSQSGNYPPPAAIYTPPSNVFPYNPPTPTFYGGTPPPPDPIVPWFPYYYKDPPRNPNKSSAEDVRNWSTAVVFLVHLVVFQLLVLC